MNESAKSTLGRALPFIASIAAGFLFFAALHAATEWFGDAFTALRVNGDGSRVSALGSIFVLAMLAALLGLLFKSPRARRAEGWLAGIAFVLAATSSLFDQRNAHLARFGDVLTYEPNDTFVDSFPNRPVVRYRNNEHGLRGPSWSDAKDPGAVRIVIIGDSFVYGSGVEWEDTLGESLGALLRARSPTVRWEVLNLGIGGDNLVSHVAVVKEATARLSPDLIVLCLTLPNDLNDDDDQRERDLASRLSGFNVVRWAFGSFFANMLWSAQSDSGESSDALDVLDRHAKEMDLARSRMAKPPPMIVFTYFDYPRAHPEALTMLAQIRGATVISGPSDPSLYIPKDGHPNAAGNRVFARQIADGIAKLPLVATDPRE